LVVLGLLLLTADFNPEEVMPTFASMVSLNADPRASRE